MFDELTDETFRRTILLLRKFDKLPIRPMDLQAECLAECWLAVEQGQLLNLVPTKVSNRLRLNNRPAAFDVQNSRAYVQTVNQPDLDRVNRIDQQIDAQSYMDVIKQTLKPNQLALLEARELRDVSFDDLAVEHLQARGEPLTEVSQRRESARLRKQLNRLRARCAAAIQKRYPNAAEDIACWN